MVKVSIITPIYNVERYLCRCLDSLIAQTYKNIEIILVDDGSTDGSASICDCYAFRDNRIKVKHIDNGGVSNARNLGLSIATGEYITFVDSDDWIDCYYIENWVKAASQHAGDVFIGGYIEDYGHGEKFEINKCNCLTAWNNMECIYNIFVRNTYQDGFTWGVCGKFFRREVCFDETFPSDVTMGEDAIWLWKVLKNATLVFYIPSCGYHYFQRDDSVMHRPSVGNILDDMKMYDFFYNDRMCYEDGYLREYFKYRYYASKVTVVVKLCLHTDAYKIMAVHKAEMLKNNLLPCIQAEWNLHKFKGLCKVMIALISCKLTSKFIKKLYVCMENVKKNEKDSCTKIKKCHSA